MGRAISVAVRAGRGVEEAVDRARQFNMPKENISRAIERASGGEKLEEAMFEGFLPGGAAVLVQTLSDNHLRTAQEVRGILDKGGGSLGSSGSVGYLFNQLGELVVELKTNQPADEQELAIIDLGVGDIAREEQAWIIHCEPKHTFEVKNQLQHLGYQLVSAELVMHPTALVEVAAETQAKIEAILGKLEDLDDVQKVYTNYS
mgnify:FL=1